jgi:phosphopantothenoylcysteine synthetase/decarboxylase
LAERESEVLVEERGCGAEEEGEKASAEPDSVVSEADRFDSPSRSCGFSWMITSGPKSRELRLTGGS